MALSRFLRFLERYEIIYPFLLFAFFLAVSLPGISWGVPALWNPDEMVWRADSALRGELIFDETEPDFNYPSLPKYVQFGIGKLVYGLGFSTSKFFIAARSFSALLGALSAALIYYLARMIGAKERISVLAGFLYIISGIAAANARFAHNDLYLQFFGIVCVFFAIKYHYTKMRLWIYLSFFAVGLAASSKYTGGSLVLVPVFVFTLMNWNDLRRNWLSSIGVLLAGGLICFGGYVLGTPKALLSPIYYFGNVIPALQRYTQYGLRPSSLIGLYGQWNVLKSAVGIFAYFLFLASVFWFSVKILLRGFGKIQLEEKYVHAIIILIITLLIFDLPFLISVNYIPRYFIPFVPFLSILGAFLLKDLFDITSKQGWKFAPIGLSTLMVIGVSYSLLRLVSISLLFMNDARIPASEYISTIRGFQNTVEYTLYPPLIEKKQFYGAARNYPIYFVKYPGESVPTGGRFEYNRGEQGLIEREVDYLVIDSLTYGRFRDEYICQTNPVECDFFEKLLAGETSYQLVKEFKYSLPPYLPFVAMSAVNPEIKIYQRVP